MSYNFNDLCNSWCSRENVYYKNDYLQSLFCRDCNGSYYISWKYYNTVILLADYRLIEGTYKIISLSINLSYTTVSTMKRIRAICRMYGISVHIKNGEPIVTYKGDVIAVNRDNRVCIMLNK
jgi:hypothetical protein